MEAVTENRIDDPRPVRKRSSIRFGQWIAISLIFGAFLGWGASCQLGDPAHNRTIAMSWNDREDAKYGKNFYGAQVYLEPRWGYYSVRARVRIGPGNGMWHDCEEIGQAKTEAEAVEKWGKISWTAEGLNFGDPANGGYHLPRKTYETHR